MQLFRDDNTDGYSTVEMEELNAEWATKAESLGLEHGTDEYYVEAQEFADEVARR